MHLYTAKTERPSVIASSVVPPSPLRPPLMQRLGFGVIFAGAGYVTSTGDIYNGTGISTGIFLVPLPTGCSLTQHDKLGLLYTCS